MNGLEKEYLLSFKQSIFKIGEGLAQNKFTAEDIGDVVPGLLHLNNQQDLLITYMSKTGEEWGGSTLEEIHAMGDEYFEKHLEPSTWNILSKRFSEFVQLDDASKVHCDLIFYRKDIKQPYLPMLTNFRILPNTGLILSISTPIESIGLTAKKIARLMELDRFYKNNYQRFETLTKREVEILTFIAEGYKNEEIAERLFISKHTIRTHRNRIYKKLDIKHFKDILRYAQAFDLI